MRTAALTILLCLAGCQSVTHDLEQKWEPLTRIKQSKTLAFKAGARTIGDTVYVSDLESWLKEHPEPLFSAVLLHEQVHAKRQKAYDGGVWRWIGHYVSDPKFMWAEEQLAYYVEIQYAKSHGGIILVDEMAEGMSRYLSIRGPMVSKEDAKKWIQDVLAGKWKPPE